MKNHTSVTLEQLEKCLADLSGSKQKCSVLEFIYFHPRALTHEIAAGGGAINIPHIIKEIRPICYRHGIVIINYLPPESDRNVNRFGDKTPEHRWFLLSISSLKTASESDSNNGD